MNSAQRLLHICDALLHIKQDRAMIDTWAQVFEVPTSDTNKEDAVVECLMALRSEIDFTKRILTERFSVPGALL